MTKLKTRRVPAQIAVAVVPETDSNAAGAVLVALATDGTMWMADPLFGCKWTELPALPLHVEEVSDQSALGQSIGRSLPLASGRKA